MITTLLERRASVDLAHPRDPGIARIFGGGAATTSKIDVNEETAMRFSACYAAIRIIAETIASLPIKVYERLPDGGRAEVTQHPAYWLLNATDGQPNPDMTAFDLRENMGLRTLAWGNGYSEATYNNRGEVAELHPLQPWAVHPKRTASRSLAYEVSEDGGGTRMLDSTQVLHFRGIGGDGIVGWSPIRLMAEAIGVGLAAERFAAAFFGNSARPSMLIKMPIGKQLGEVAEKSLRETWGMYSGENAHRPAVVDNGADVQLLTMPLNEAQFIEGRKFSVEEIARLYRVPMHMLGDLSRATFSNIEQQSLDFEKHTIRPWLVRFEQQYNRLLISKRQRGRLYIRHSVEGLLRGDIKTRFEAYAIALNNGWKNIDEVRANEDMNPLPGGIGQEHFIQLNMTTVARAVAGEPEDEEEPDTDDMPEEDEPQGEPEEQEDDDDSRAFLRHLLEESVSGLVGREVHNATRAAKRAAAGEANFVEWLGGFYEKHADLMRKKVGERHAAAVQEHCEASRSALLAACECRADELAEHVASLVAEWESERSGTLVNSILGED